MRVRPLPGRVVIKEDRRLSTVILLGHSPDDRTVTTHRGTVIDAEPLVLPNGAVVPLDFKVGDVVQFHFEATQKGRTTTWNGHEDVLVMAQREIDAVIE